MLPRLDVERPSLRTSSAVHSGPRALFTPDLVRPSLRTSCALHSGLRALFTPDLALHSGPRAPFTPDLVRPSLRTSCALHSGPRAPFTPDLERPSLRTSSALHSGPRRPSLRTSCAFHSGPRAPFTPDLVRPSLRTSCALHPGPPALSTPESRRRSVRVVRSEDLEHFRVVGHRQRAISRFVLGRAGRRHDVGACGHAVRAHPLDNARPLAVTWIEPHSKIRAVLGHRSLLEVRKCNPDGHRWRSALVWSEGPDLARFSIWTSSALHPGPHVPFTPDLVCPSLRTSRAVNFGLQVLFARLGQGRLGGAQGARSSAIKPRRLLLRPPPILMPLLATVMPVPAELLVTTVTTRPSASVTVPPPFESSALI